MALSQRGIAVSPATVRLGTIEAHVRYDLARRMKRLGASWTESGGDKMARVLSARSNGVLERYTSRWRVEPARREHLAQAAQVEVKRKMAEAGSWLKTRGCRR